MAGKSLTIVQRIRSLVGADAAVETDATGMPRIAPRSEEAVAAVLAAASEAGWRVRVEGTGSWMPPDAEADLAVTSRNLTAVTYLDAADLVATSEAGVVWGDFRRALADQGAWVALDPPGSGRSVGSVTVTGTAGPLRGGFGNVRDHLLGLTLVTGDGRIVRPGGKVVKNVAGFDLTKLAVGSFGAFGIVTSATFRLRAVPRADVTLVASGMRDALLTAAREVLASGITPGAMELLSPVAAGASEWMLALRLIGADPEVQATRDTVCGAASLALTELPARESAHLWPEASGGATQGPITMRLGALPSALDDALDLVAHHLPEGWVSVAVGAGTIRWSGEAALDRLKLLRHAAAQQEMPLTLERAPWAVRGALGHFGAYREGVGRLVGALRRSFDPAAVLVAPVGDPA
jgi:FAD/FMN-containing dehydrogenase